MLFKEYHKCTEEGLSIRIWIELCYNIVGSMRYFFHCAISTRFQQVKNYQSIKTLWSRACLLFPFIKS